MIDNGQFELYASGADMWRDTVAMRGLLEARIITHSYLDLQARNPDITERLFCEQAREAMALDFSYTKTEIYWLPSRKFAEVCGNLETFDTNIKVNRLCAGDIAEAIRQVEYGKTDNGFKYAISALVDHYSFECLVLVLKSEIYADLNYGNFSDELYK